MKIVFFCDKFIFVVFILVTTVLLSSCNQDKDKFIYYPNGKVKMQYSYQERSQYDSKVSEYDSSGNIREIYYLKNNKLFGKAYSFRSTKRVKNKLKYVDTYRNGVEHGISISNSISWGKPYQEYLIIGGKVILAKRYLEVVDENKYLFDNHIVKNDSNLINNGYIYYTMDDKILKDESEYFISKSDDTISMNTKLYVGVDFINKDNWYLDLEIGELDSNLNFVSEVSVFKGENSITYEYSNHEKGWNLITGFLHAKKIIHKDSLPINKKYIYYHEYYAK